MVILFNKWLTGLVFFMLMPVAGYEKAAVLHPYHVSATEMEYNIGEGRIEITSKIFTDDFEAVLAKIYKAKADFANQLLKKHMDDLVKQYILTHLSVRSNGRLMPLQFVGWELDHEAVYVYSTANAQNINTGNITVENTLLHDMFTDQMNIIHFIIGANRKSTRLSYPERKAPFHF